MVNDVHVHVSSLPLFTVKPFKLVNSTRETPWGVWKDGDSCWSTGCAPCFERWLRWTQCPFSCQLQTNHAAFQPSKSIRSLPPLGKKTLKKSTLLWPLLQMRRRFFTMAWTCLGSQSADWSPTRKRQSPKVSSARGEASKVISRAAATTASACDKFFKVGHLSSVRFCVTSTGVRQFQAETICICVTKSQWTSAHMKNNNCSTTLDLARYAHMFISVLTSKTFVVWTPPGRISGCSCSRQACWCYSNTSGCVGS